MIRRVYPAGRQLRWARPRETLDTPIARLFDQLCAKMSAKYPSAAAITIKPPTLVKNDWLDGMQHRSEASQHYGGQHQDPTPFVRQPRTSLFFADLRET